MTLLEKIIYLNYIKKYDLDDIYLMILELILKNPQTFRKLK